MSTNKTKKNDFSLFTKDPLELLESINFSKKKIITTTNSGDFLIYVSSKNPQSIYAINKDQNQISLSDLKVRTFTKLDHFNFLKLWNHEIPEDYEKAKEKIKTYLIESQIPLLTGIKDKKRKNQKEYNSLIEKLQYETNPLIPYLNIEEFEKYKENSKLERIVFEESSILEFFKKRESKLKFDIFYLSNSIKKIDEQEIKKLISYFDKNSKKDSKIILTYPYEKLKNLKTNNKDLGWDFTKLYLDKQENSKNPNGYLILTKSALNLQTQKSTTPNQQNKNSNLAN